MKHCAFLSLDERGDYVIDDEHAVAPLAELGWQVATVSWRQQTIPWRDFDAVVIRSTWDYWYDVPGFLDTLADIDRQTRLANSLQLVHWNLKKSYLRDLEQRGVPIVPTLWLEGFDATRVDQYAERLGSNSLVIKPEVGANGDDAFRLSRSDDVERLSRIAGCFSGRNCLLQPFRSRVLEEGEYSLFYFNGRYSHAILKTPAAGEFRSQEERGGRIRSIEPQSLLEQRAARALAAVSPSPLYARVDLVRNAADDFELMELELIEPSLYLRTHRDAAGHFARAVNDWFD